MEKSLVQHEESWDLPPTRLFDDVLEGDSSGVRSLEGAIELDVDFVAGDLLLLAEDRKRERRMVRTDCDVVAEAGFRPLGKFTIDVSSTGIMVDSGAKVDVGEPVLFSMRLPFGGMWIDGEGIVSRRVVGRRAGDCGSGIAIAFVRVDRLYRALLEAQLEYFPRAPELRRRRVDYAASIRRFSLE